MWRIHSGGIMVIAGIAGFIEAHSDLPVAGSPGSPLPSDRFERARFIEAGIKEGLPTSASGLSPDAYVTA
jgi:hypothetical protein